MVSTKVSGSIVRMIEDLEVMELCSIIWERVLGRNPEEYSWSPPDLEMVIDWLDTVDYLWSIKKLRSGNVLLFVGNTGIECREVGITSSMLRALLIEYEGRK